MNIRCWEWAKAARGRSRARPGASSRCSSIGGASSTRCSRAGRPTCTARATRPRCCSGRAAGACSSPRRGGKSTFATANRGVFLPWKPTDADRAPQTERNQQQNLAKGLPPPDAVVPGLYDLFIFDAHDPAKAMKDFSVISGPAAMPPKWSLGYMQSHRTLEDDTHDARRRRYLSRRRKFRSMR